MRPLRTRDDLLAVVARFAPSKACQTAISQGRAHVLGGFTPASGIHQLVVRVRSEYGREWLVGVELDPAERSSRVVYLDTPPWHCWDGRSDGKRPLIDGDSPVAWAFEKMKARQRGERRSGAHVQ